MRMALLLSVVLLSTSVSAVAQSGNGCNGDLVTTPFHSGSNFTATVKGASGADYALFIADNAGPVVIPGLGTFSVDLFSPFFTIIGFGNLNASGEAALTTFIPNDAVWNSIVFFGQAIVGDAGCPSGYAITRALRFDWEAPDSFTAMTSMSTARALATGDLLNDGSVFVAGGGSGNLTSPVGTATTELWSPFTRSWTPGPALSQARAFHQSVVLNDGRVLLIGGTGATGNVVSSCEIFDPVAGTITAAASMGVARAGSTATKLVNGKVLVTGGVTTFTIPPGTTSIAPILATCQDTSEVYDPVLDTWTAVPGVMAGKRFAHAASLLQNGKVLIISGINGTTSIAGNDVPTFTQTNNLYNPTTNAYEAAAALPAGIFGFGGIPGRAGHRATTMNNGEVFVGGGIYSNLFVPTTSGLCARYNVAANSWTATNTLATGIALHGQVLLKNGKCHLSGGGSGTLLAYTATNVCATRTQGSNAFTLTTALPLARGSHLAVLLRDGSILIAGGGDAAGVGLSSAELYTPAP